MRRVLAVTLACASLVACSTGPDDATDAASSAASAVRMLDFCGNGIDEDGDGVDRVCETDSAPPTGPRSVAILRGTGEEGDLSYDVEVRLVPDGDPGCPNPPVAWPSVEGCVGKSSCAIQLRADVRIVDPVTQSVVNAYTLKPRQCAGGGLPNSTMFSWNAAERAVNVAATAIGLGGGGQRLTLRNTKDGGLFGSGTIRSAIGAMHLYFAGVESL